MKKILVVSDTHGDINSLERVVRRHSDVYGIYHLGDGLEEAVEVAHRLGLTSFRMVKGNNDWSFRNTPYSCTEDVNSKTIFFTHGHNYSVKYGLNKVILAATQQNADILLFGHTHTPLVDYIKYKDKKPLHIFNPGSLGFTSTYGIIEIDSNSVNPKIYNLSGRDFQ